MVSAFESLGCRVDLYAMRKGKGEARFGRRVKIEEVRVSRPTRWWRRRIERAERPSNRAVAIHWLLWHRDFLRHVARRFRERPPDLIYARSAWLAFPNARLARLARVPTALEVNAVFSREKADRDELAFPGLTRRFERDQFLAASRILPVSAELADQIAEFGIPRERIRVTPNAVDLDLFRPVERRPADDGRFAVGAVNSFRPYHGMATLLRAAALLRPRLPGLRLILVGGTHQFEEMRALAAELGLADVAEFAGVVDHARVPELLARCDVAAAPYEGESNTYNCPMKLFEYAAMKIPIVASRWGDIPNHLEDGRTACLHAPGDAADLADALERVARDPEAARRRAEAAFAVAERNTWRGIARRVLEDAGVAPPADGGDS